MLKIELSLFDWFKLLQKNVLPVSPKEDLSLSTYATQEFPLKTVTQLVLAALNSNQIFLASGIAAFSTSVHPCLDYTLMDYTLLDYS